MSNTERAALEALARTITQRLGDNLSAFCVYGASVRHDVPIEQAQLTTLLVVRDASPRALRPIEQTIRSWTKKGHPAPLIFSERAWQGSTDVFPIEIEDMREAHDVLAGSSPFEGLVTRPEHLRRELEREVRSKILRLRTEYVATAAHGASLEQLLLESAETFFVLFRALLRLVGEKPPQEREPLVTAAARAARMDPAAFTWILDAMAHRRVRRLKPHDEAAQRYLEELEKLSNFVDGMVAGNQGRTQGVST